MSISITNVTHRIYDPLVSYRSVKLDHYNEGETLSTQAQKAKKVWEQQKAFVYDDTDGPKEEKIQLERVLFKVIPNKDGRERINNTTQWPHVVHAQLTMKFDRKTYCGSGAMVGPHHLLTCAHNVYDPDTKKFADSISVYPALNDNFAPFGEVHVTRAYVFSQWTDQKNKKYDIALLILNTSIGKFTGWCGLLCTEDRQLSQEKVNIVGYPGDKGCKQMWGMTHTIRKISAEEFEYDIDTYAGQSGSAISINKWGTPMVLGVHTLGTDSANFGVRISKDKFTKFLEILSQTFKLEKIDKTKQEPPQSLNTTTFAAAPSPITASTSTIPSSSGSTNSTATNNRQTEPPKIAPSSNTADASPKTSSSASTSNTSTKSRQTEPPKSDSDTKIRDQYIQSIKVDPTDAEPYAQLARTLNVDEKVRLPNGKDFTAQELYQKSLQLNPNLAWVYYELANIAKGTINLTGGFTMNDRLTKGDLYIRCLKLDPTHHDAISKLAIIVSNSSTYNGNKELQNVFVNFIEKNPQNPQAIFGLACIINRGEVISISNLDVVYTSVKHKPFYSGFQLLSRCIEIDPSYAPPYAKLIKTLNGDDSRTLNQKKELFVKWIKADLANTLPLYHLAQTLSNNESIRLANGEFVDRKKLYIRILELNPNHAHAMAYLARELKDNESVQLSGTKLLSKENLLGKVGHLPWKDDEIAL